MAKEEGVAVEVIAAGLGRYANDSASRAAKFCVVILRRDLGLADRVQRGVDDDDAQHRVTVIDSIEDETLFTIV